MIQLSERKANFIVRNDRKCIVFFLLGQRSSGKCYLMLPGKVMLQNQFAAT